MSSRRAVGDPESDSQGDPQADPQADPEADRQTKIDLVLRHQPGWDGYSDVNCPDFDTHAQAQSFFKGTGGTRSNDPYGLDRDHDGIACETLP